MGIDPSLLDVNECIRIRCESHESTYLVGKPHATLLCWVAQPVEIGEVIRFTDYDNNEDGWTVIDVDLRSTVKDCIEKWGADCIRHIDRQPNQVELL